MKIVTRNQTLEIPAKITKMAKIAQKAKMGKTVKAVNPRI